MDLKVKGSNIRRLRMSAGMTQTELSKKTGFTPQMISKMESKESNNFKISTVQKLCVGLGVSPNALLNFDSELEFIKNMDIETVKIPVYGIIPAGKPIEAIEADLGYMPVDKDSLKSGKEYIGLKVKGDSMYPFYQNEDIVLVELTPDYADGDDVVVSLGDDYNVALKRIYRTDTGIRLKPLNTDYPERNITKEDNTEVRVLGIVKGLVRGLY